VDVIAVDLLIVGAGPAGLYGAYYAGFRGLSTAVVDSLPEPGGQVTALYPEKMIFDVAGFPEVRGRELVERLVTQAAPFEPHYVLGEKASKLTRATTSPAGRSSSPAASARSARGRCRSGTAGWAGAWCTSCRSWTRTPTGTW
jgi:phytoene dehydrogenase-like protein